MSDDLSLTLANQHLDIVKKLAAQTGLKYQPLADNFMACGFAVGFGQNDYVVVSIAGFGSESIVNLTSGVLVNIEQDRLRALDVANKFTRDNAIFPHFLHDAEAGWAIMVQSRFPIQVLANDADYFGMMVRTMPQIVTASREWIAAESPLGGRPWEWNAEDLDHLLTRSTL